MDTAGAPVLSMQCGLQSNVNIKTQTKREARHENSSCCPSMMRLVEGHHMFNATVCSLSVSPNLALQKCSHSCLAASFINNNRSNWSIVTKCQCSICSLSCSPQLTNKSTNQWINNSDVGYMLPIEQLTAVWRQNCRPTSILWLRCQKSNIFTTFNSSRLFHNRH